MDKLKKYLKQYEDRMNVDSPGNEVWQGIQSKTPAGSTRGTVAKLTVRYLAVACILVLIGFGIKLVVKGDKDVIEPGRVVKNNQAIKRDTFSIQKNIIENTNQGNVLNVNPSLSNNEISLSSTVKKVKTPSRKQADSKVDIIGQSYVQLINLQLKRLHTTPVYAERPNYFTDFKIQLRQMDKDEVAIRKDIRVYGLNDQLLGQLINIYQQKLNVLKSLQAEINKMNNRVREKEHPSDNRSPYYLDI